MTTGEKIHAARKRSGMTQGELSERIRANGGRMDCNRLSLYEHGKHAPSMAVLQSIAAALGVKIGKLIGD